VLGVSVDSEDVHRAWAERGDLGDLKFPLLSDLKKEVSAAYGVLKAADGHALRATFLINPEGVILHMSINSHDAGRNVAEILRILDAFQSGGLCPANWKKGDPHL